MSQLGNAVGWFEIYVNDLDRARKFYEGVFDTKLTKLENPAPGEGPAIEMWSFPGEMTSYGAPGALVRMEGVQAGGNSVLVYFSCEDCATEQDRITKLGGKVQRPKFSIGQYGFIALAFDTEGNMIGLHSLK